jgi:hypothetical protein
LEYTVAGDASALNAMNADFALIEMHLLPSVLPELIPAALGIES